jgi:hypothetical protein
MHKQQKPSCLHIYDYQQQIFCTSLSNILIKQLGYKKKTRNKAHIRKPYLPLAVTFCKHEIQALVDRDVVCTQCAPAK